MDEYHSISVRIEAPAEMVKTWLAKAVEGLHRWHRGTITQDEPRSQVWLQTGRWTGDRYRVPFVLAFERDGVPDAWDVAIMDGDALLVEATALAAERTRLDMGWGDYAHALGLDLLAAMATDYPETAGQLDAAAIAAEIHSIVESVSTDETGDGEVIRFTPKESDVVDLVASGCSADQICEKLIMAPNTLRAHLGNIKAKIKVAEGKPSEEEIGLPQLAAWLKGHGYPSA